MKITELDRARVTRWAADQVPLHAREQVRVGWTARGIALTVTEERAPWDGVGSWTSRKVARIRHEDTGWHLDGADRNGRWYRRDDIPAQPVLDDALGVLGDGRHAFWG